MNEQHKRSTWFWVLIGGSLFAVFLAVIVGLAFAIVHSAGGGDFTSLGSGNIGVIDVDGIILSADTLVDQMRKFEDDSSVKAIVLHINSPGGGAAASQEIYEEVRRIRNEKKK